MPTNAVKTARDEHLWTQAKQLARKQGRAKDYSYIMGIYQRSKGEKSMLALMANGEDELRKARKAPQSQTSFSFPDSAPKAKAPSGGPFIGPRGGKWADAKHTIPWRAESSGGKRSQSGTESPKAEPPKAESSKGWIKTKEGYKLPAPPEYRRGGPAELRKYPDRGWVLHYDGGHWPMPKKGSFDHAEGIIKQRRMQNDELIAQMQKQPGPKPEPTKASKEHKAAHQKIADDHERMVGNHKRLAMKHRQARNPEAEEAHTKAAKAHQYAVNAHDHAAHDPGESARAHRVGNDAGAESKRAFEVGIKVEMKNAAADISGKMKKASDKLKKLSGELATMKRKGVAQMRADVDHQIRELHGQSVNLMNMQSPGIISHAERQLDSAQNVIGLVEATLDAYRNRKVHRKAARKAQKAKVEAIEYLDMTTEQKRASDDFNDYLTSEMFRTMMDRSYEGGHADYANRFHDQLKKLIKQFKRGPDQLPKPTRDRAKMLLRAYTLMKDPRTGPALVRAYQAEEDAWHDRTNRTENDGSLGRDAELRLYLAVQKVSGIEPQSTKRFGLGVMDDNKTEKAMGLMDEFDKLEKAAAGEIIGRTADGKEVYAQGEDEEDEELQAQNDNGKKQPPAKGDQQPQQAQPGGPPQPPQQQGADNGGPPKGPPQPEGDEGEQQGEGSHDHHAKRALSHLQAAQAHASAAHSAKKVEEAKEHKEIVSNAKDMSEQAMADHESDDDNGGGNGQQPQQFGGKGKEQKQVPQNIAKSIQRNNLHIDLSAEDSVLALLEQDGSAVGAQGDAHAYDGRNRLLGMRGERLSKATIYQGEHDGPRGGDSREAIARAQVLAETVELDEAGNHGNGGLPEWYRDAWGKLSSEEKALTRQGMAGPLATGWQKGLGANETVQIIDDDSPYQRAVMRDGHRPEHQSAMRQVFQGNGREQPK